MKQLSPLLCIIIFVVVCVFWVNYCLDQKYRYEDLTRSSQIIGE
jgi:hypothetical protein